MKEFDVLVVGELNVDIILDSICGFPEVGKEILAKDLNMTLGSSSAIFASNLSVMGAKVAFVGMVGKDGFSDFVKESLIAKMVNTDGIISSDAYKTGLTMVMNYGTDRANVTFPGAMEHLFEKDIGTDTLNQAKHLHVSSIFLQTGLKGDVVALFRKAKELGLTTSMDPQWDPSEEWDLNLPELLPYIDVFLPNTVEICQLTGCGDINSALDKIRPYANIVVVKDGDNGAHLWDGQKLITKPAHFNDNIVDCIGAGDSFDAGFISQFIQGRDLEYCLRVGNISGAINTTESGGTGAFVSVERIQDIAKKKFSFKF
jgi:sugar/nucleoside kinase (ribokinase family)